MKKKKFNPIREIVADMHTDGVRFDERVLAAIRANKNNDNQENSVELS
ncbi:MAG: hypothetical protein HKN48_05900 [Flavobacteriaceae bacterium]|nr:hypothetical protein [Flavobacteriaceae bacterium]